MFSRPQLKRTAPLIDGLLYELAARSGHFDAPESMKHF
jgi:hypothetical protein